VGRIRVLVADGHRIFAEALATALAAEPDIDVAAAGSIQAAERALDRAAADNRPFQVLLVDADLAPGSPPPVDARLVALGGRAEPGTEHHPPDPRRPGVRAVLPLPAQRRPATSARITPPGSPGSPGSAGSGSAAPVPAVVAVDGGRARIPAPRSDSGGGAAAPPRAREAREPREYRDSREAVDGIALVASARAAHPELRAVVLAAADDPRRTVRALQAGASGWVAKESSLGRLTAIVRGVLRDETHIPPLLLTGVVRELTAARRDRTESERLVESLTPREKQVLRCMVAGLGRQAVADRLYLSPHTVRTHMQNVLGKLGVHSTLAAVALARRAGVGPAD
jgi:DNA-binding NarL/FixJ family response regulator